MRRSMTHHSCREGPDLRNLRVTRVERIENMTLWLNYQRQKTGLRERLRRCNHAPEQLGALLAARYANPYITGERIIDAEINEFGLWHGTRPQTADILATSGFDNRVARDSGLYGAGSYFADAMCKSNQYARDANADGEHCMLYCRVTMGSAFSTPVTHQNERIPPPNPATPGEPFDSIFAMSGVANQGHQHHNEFVVFTQNQVYPEYIIWYTAG